MSDTNPIVLVDKLVSDEIRKHLKVVHERDTLRARLKLAEAIAGTSAEKLLELNRRLNLARDALREAPQPEIMSYKNWYRQWFDGPRAKALEDK